MVVILRDEFRGKFWLILQFSIYLRFGWINFEKIGNQIKDFSML